MVGPIPKAIFWTRIAPLIEAGWDSFPFYSQTFCTDEQVGTVPHSTVKSCARMSCVGLGWGPWWQTMNTTPLTQSEGEAVHLRRRVDNSAERWAAGPLIYQ